MLSEVAVVVDQVVHGPRYVGVVGVGGMVLSLAAG